MVGMQIEGKEVHRDVIISIGKNIIAVVLFGSFTLCQSHNADVMYSYVDTILANKFLSKQT